MEPAVARCPPRRRGCRRMAGQPSDRLRERVPRTRQGAESRAPGRQPGGCPAFAGRGSARGRTTVRSPAAHRETGLDGDRHGRSRHPLPARRRRRFGRRRSGRATRRPGFRVVRGCRIRANTRPSTCRGVPRRPIRGRKGPRAAGDYRAAGAFTAVGARWNPAAGPPRSLRVD